MQIQPILGYFWAIFGLYQPPGPPFWISAPPFLHILDPPLATAIIQRFSRAGPRGRAREWATLGVHPLSWLLSNNQLEEVCGTLTKDTFSSRLLLSNQDKGCTPSVAHSLPLPPGFCSTCQVCYRMSTNNVLEPFTVVYNNTILKDRLRHGSPYNKNWFDDSFN